MIVLVCFAYTVAGNFLMNGLLHLLLGLLGKRFVARPKAVSQKQFEKIYQGRLFSSAVFNAVYGLAQIVAVLLALAAGDSFRFAVNLETAMLLVGVTFGVVSLSWKYEGTIG